MLPPYKIFALSDSATTIDFGAVIDININTLVAQLCNYFHKNRFHGFIEVVPAYASLTVFYDVIQVKKAFKSANTAYEIVENYLSEALKNIELTEKAQPTLIEIPVVYDGEDLSFVAAHNQLSIEDVIKIHSQPTYRVYMMGFLPGFAYLGGLDERIATPRKQTPRVKVPAGSVGIAGKQTGIYPLESPGGWQLIGHTTTPLFSIGEGNTTLLKAGDWVKFIPIS